MIRVTDTIFLSPADLEERFIRSSGPGGQNVNKVATSVQLRFDAKACETISPTVFHRLKVLAGRRMSADGVVVISARTFRNRERNREEALKRLIELIQKAATPRKPRRQSRPSYTAKQKRMDIKRKRGEIKKNRARVSTRD